MLCCKTGIVQGARLEFFDRLFKISLGLETGFKFLRLMRLLYSNDLSDHDMVATKVVCRNLTLSS